MQFSPLSGKKRNERTDCDCRSIRNLTTLPGIPPETSYDRHRQSNQSPHHGGKHHGKQKLLRTHPRSDSSHQLYIPHPHPSNPRENPENQGAKSKSFHALAKSMPAKQPGRHHQASQHEWQYQPIGNSAAAQIREGSHGKNDKRRPPGDRVHTADSFLPSFGNTGTQAILQPNRF